MRATSGARNGFTLVELLVVIGIIAVLISILLPSLGRARESSREIMCASNLRQWGAALTMYVDTYKGKFPSDGPEDGDTAGAAIQGPDALGWESQGLWINALPPYLNSRTYDQLQTDHALGGPRLPVQGEQSVFVCPSATTASGPGATQVNGDYFQMYGRTATSAAAVPRDVFIAYTLNSKLNSNTPKGVKLSQLKQSSEFVVMLERRLRGGEVTSADDVYYQSQGGPANRLTSRTLNRIKADWQRFSARHRKNSGGNVLFADGHVSFVSMREALTAGVVGSDMNRPGYLRWSYEGVAAP